MTHLTAAALCALAVALGMVLGALLVVALLLPLLKDSEAERKALFERLTGIPLDPAEQPAPVEPLPYGSDEYEHFVEQQRERALKRQIEEAGLG